ncbi:MAG TPA: 2-oxoacid:acceptor oxidoreductase subunit alpha [Candidatus Bipolaricaulis anaerobius]|jgi:2-oxoglutarate ferredoxin oxidoreductase subunit alpha|nr:2-oxoacid:acceptor oxidoreductase subunit alpha [Candidatus Bipolaricaulis sp.]MDD2912109.1 2-oxoacid:acceptor oxidoreductase subunit alpha [Candidatus Bipolaricaulis anaerobius]MDD5763773.1 2-oxoacid:acceptor oxidoreductase subunit alpha [Candidatus Bipolaricaulis anaerobius]HNR24891.1 2-oxoacid:acceptor oxidoreductase subunit alpha [Candidatus Bipolaricaulis anaerobius]HNS24244.1 2-oxoacid:acceptor oxidoreductase subunit alpha [Candidatus Bipolaricaulis anaerobius]
MPPKATLSGIHFMNGDEAIAEGAIAAGCRFFAAYPITPQSEIAERLSWRLPRVGGAFIQMEDELGAMAAVVGAAWGGAKAMTATSGPGFSLMMENLGLAIMTETPCVVVDVQRGAPSTGLPTAVGQGDMMQARWGSHGHYEIIALVPASPQEAFDLTVRAFALSERFRVPVLLMTDEVVGHMYERVEIPGEVPLAPRRRPQVPPEEFIPYQPDPDLVPPMACAGEGYRVHVTGLTHDERGYPDMSAEAHDRLVRRLAEKVLRYREEYTLYEEVGLDDAEVAVVSYGISARVAYGALAQARQQGIKAGMLRLITAWPFPDERVRALADQVRGIAVVELNLGQMSREVERATRGKVPLAGVFHAGGRIHTPEEVLAGIKEVARCR